MKLTWDHHNSILQLSGSLFQHYGIERGHGTDCDVDAWLGKIRPRCVISLLIDAMGISIMAKHLPEDSFLRSHLLKEITTVFPPTTAAATTSYRSGYSPAETGWLGWNQYFPEKDDELILFFSRGMYSGISYEPEFVSSVLPVKAIDECLMEKGFRADAVWPGWSAHNGCDTFEQLLAKTLELSHKNDFLYVYWDVLDTLMHEHGTDEAIIRDTLRDYDQKIAAFAGQLSEDTVLLVTADHSQINTRPYDLGKDEELCACLKGAPAIEQRTVSFRIKDGMKETFAKLFEERFPDDFVLLEPEEALELFGEGTPHERTKEFLGDFLAVAISDRQLDYHRARAMKGNHAGFLAEERMIPVILYPKP